MHGMTGIKHNGVTIRKVNETYTIDVIDYDVIVYVSFNAIDGYYDEQGFSIEKIEYRIGDVYENFDNIKLIEDEIKNGLWENEIFDIIYQNVSDIDFSDGIVYIQSSTTDIIDGIIYVISCYIETTKINSVIQKYYEINDITVCEQSSIGYDYVEPINPHIKKLCIDRVNSGYYAELLYTSVQTK